MQRYFVDSINNNKFCLNESDSYHCLVVMRSKVKEELEIVCDKRLYLGKIESLDNFVSGIILEEIDSSFERLDVTIAQSLVNESKMDLILQKSVELGVNKIIPLKVSRCVVNYDKKEDKKLLRWQKIMQEASSQSKRLNIPVIDKINNLDDLIGLNYDYKFLCSVNESSQTIKMVLQNVKVCDRIIFVIGPEGGFSDSEESYLVQNGFIRISLGDLVLRTETASLTILSMINYHFMR